MIELPNYIRTTHHGAVSIETIIDALDTLRVLIELDHPGVETDWPGWPIEDPLSDLCYQLTNQRGKSWFTDPSHRTTRGPGPTPGDAA